MRPARLNSPGRSPAAHGTLQLAAELGVVASWQPRSAVAFEVQHTTTSSV